MILHVLRIAIHSNRVSHGTITCCLTTPFHEFHVSLLKDSSIIFGVGKLTLSLEQHK